MTSTTVYRQCGLRLRAQMELDLPEAPDTDFDVDVRWGPDLDPDTGPPEGDSVAVYQTSDSAWYTATATTDGYYIRFRDCGEVWISEDLREVTVRRIRSGRHELLPILMAGTVSAFLLALRGETVLHASAVAVDGRAIAFVGQSGRGKSTMAALLCTHGAELVTDDVLTLDAGPPVTCRGGGHELRLRDAATPLAAQRPDAATRATADDRLAFAPTAARDTEIPLSAIVIPSPSRTATEVTFHQLDPSTALFTLLAIPRVHGWEHDDVLARDFATLSEAVNHVPVYDVTIPWGPPFDPGVAPAIARLALGDIDRA